MIDTETTHMITITEVVEFQYCPRFIYFLNVLKIPQFEAKRYKVKKGREIHTRRIEQNREYLWKKIGAQSKKIDVYLASPELRVRGVVDEVLTLTDSSLAPLDFKFAPYRDSLFSTERLQVILYGLLIRICMKATVKKGFVAFIRGSCKIVEVQIDEAAEKEALKVVDQICSIIITELLPKKTSIRRRCLDCCYKNICV